ncbi:MAG: PAS domain S-box protein [Pseudomonadota bacterium]
METTTGEPEAWLANNALAILDAAVDPVITIDSKGLIQSVNRATEGVFGYAPAELMGQPLSLLMPEPYKTRHQGFIDKYLTTNEARIIGVGRELPAQRKDGTLFPMSLAISEIRDESGRHFAGIIRDLTDQKAAEANALEQRERLARISRLSTMGEMTASIAHEINQPLTAIAMYAQACMRLLDQKEPDRRKLGSALSKLNAQALRAGSVIERIQRFVRNESSEKSLVQLNELVKDLEHLAAGDARLNGILLLFDLDPALPPAFCDAVQIQQVTLNLIRNAIDAMVEVDCCYGNEVWIRTRQPQPDWIEVAVIDRGVGVSDEFEQRLFSAFHTTKADGMGMGLSICRSILESHNGLLTFERNPDQGCTFYFRLPTGAITDE